MSINVDWERKDYSRIPYWLYHDKDVYENEQKHIFYGSTWSYLCLEAEIPNPGDYKTTWVGDTPVIVNRDSEYNILAMVNRCAHRGAAVCREARGNTKVHTCIYHRWSYNLSGELVGIPFQRGINGKGGMDKKIDKTKHGLKKLRVGA
jgi:Phenylpropionate dioxygenase and related ring-hydroxylating dioxygenases, large terminal subunit